MISDGERVSARASMGDATVDEPMKGIEIEAAKKGVSALIYMYI